MTKKVIIVIVEGVSDEALLFERLRFLYSKCEIKFEIQRCDLFYSNPPRKPIKEAIGNVVKDIMMKRKFKFKDILAIIHITDTDGCFIPFAAIKVESDQEANTLYSNDEILVNSELQKQRIADRNRVKSINVATMSSIDSIQSQKLNYQLYYFSRNLEHVIFNNANPEDDTKVDNVEAFVESLSENLESFLTNFLPELTTKHYPSRHSESWTYIKSNLNSLKRGSNVTLMFEYLDLTLS